jgi:hypothetical protein
VTDRASSCEEIGELLGVYALDALDAAEAARVEEHLDTCRRCTGEVDEHRETIGLVASAGSNAPSGVWDAIAARIAAEPAPAPVPTPRLVGRTEAVRPTRGYPTRWLAAAAAAAAAVVALVAGLTVRIDHLDHQVARIGAAAQQAEGFQAAAEALVDPSTRRVALTSTSPSGSPLGLLLILPSGTAYLVAARLPTLPADRTYQLWSIVAGRAISVGLLGPHPVVAPFRVDPAVSPQDYLVTVEPSGGVVAPTTAPVARAV